MEEFYGTVAGYRAYHLARDNDIPVSDDSDIAAALLVGSEFIDARYRSSFGGLKIVGRSQVREWPRSGVVDVYGNAVAADEIPREIERATYEAALRQLALPGALFVDYTPNKYSQASVEGAVSVTFAKFGSASEIQTQFSIIDAILAPLISAANGNFSSFSGDAVRV